MVISCAAYGCTNRQKKGSNLQFHRFPFSKPALLMKWVIAIRRKSWYPTKYSYLCSCHFTDDSYNSYKSTSRRHLKSDAVPTVFNFTSHRIKSAKNKQQIKKVQSKVERKNGEVITRKENGESGSIQYFGTNGDITIDSIDHKETQIENVPNRSSTPENSTPLKRYLETNSVKRTIYKLLKMSKENKTGSENEFDIFCKTLATQLKKMPLDRALICKKQLEDVMIQEQIYQIQHSNSSLSPCENIELEL